MKSLVVYKLATPVVLSAEQLESGKFVQCGDHDASRSGWSPTIEDGFIMELSGGVKVLRFTTQVKKVNDGEVKRRLAIKKMLHVTEFGTQPNKGELATMEAEIKEGLLPSTPADEEKHTTVVITNDKVYVEGGYKQAELILANLRAILGSLLVTPIEVAENVTQRLTGMVKDELNTDKFVLADKVTLVTQDELKVSQTSGSIYGSDAVELVSNGATVTSLQLEYNSFTVFTLKDDLSISGIKYSKDLTAQLEKGDEVGSVILEVNEVISLVSNLVAEFGGLVTSDNEEE